MYASLVRNEETSNRILNDCVSILDKSLSAIIFCYFNKLPSATYFLPNLHEAQEVICKAAGMVSLKEHLGQDVLEIHRARWGESETVLLSRV